MPDVTINYKGQSIATMDDSGSKTLQTAGKYCESDFAVAYTKPAPNLQSKNISPRTSSQTIIPDSGYDGLSQVTVYAMPSGSTTQNAPTVNAATGLVTATATVSSGYQSSDTKSNTLQLSIQAAQTITPGTTDQTIASGKYLTGTQTIKGDANLIPANIASGVTIFGVTGTYGGGTVPDLETTIVTFNVPAVSITSDNYVDGTFNLETTDAPSASGWVPIGIAGWSGSSRRVMVSALYINESTNTINYRISNITSITRSMGLTIYVTYARLV